MNGITRQRVWTAPEIDQVIRTSELRLSRNRPGRPGQPGHTGSRHVLITNAELARRADEFLGNPRMSSPVACAFPGTPEAVTAVTEALNTAEGQAALGWLDDHYPTGIRVRLEARVATPFRARYSTHPDIVRKVSLTTVLVLLERTEEPAVHGLHIHTAFPILGFRRGGPAWLDSQSQWH